MNLSVVIPHYEKQKAFTATWRGLQPQLEEGDEAILVDDYSPTPWADFAFDPTSKEGLRIVRPEKKLTPHIYRLNTLRTMGIKEAVNDPVIILDPDCIPNPSLIRHAKKMFDPAILFAGIIDYFKEDGSLRNPDPRGRPGRQSRWVDRSPRGCGMVWGGIMFFSKSRTELIDWFDPIYDGSWGAEDHDFASRCYHSGMRLRYEPRLQVHHQWHPKKHPNMGGNIPLWKEKMTQYESHLNVVTSYRPAVVVLVTTTHRPYFIDQCMRGIFRNKIPLRVRLINRGDRSHEQKKALKWWQGRWAVDFQSDSNVPYLAKVRTKAMEDYAQKGYKYIVLMDDDMLIKGQSIVNLVRDAEANPHLHAIAGWYIDHTNKPKMLGGYVEKKRHYNLPFVPDVHEVDYVSSGFIIIKLKPLVPYDVEYEMGWNDWDWANEVKKRRLRLGISGNAGAYHRHLFTKDGLVYKEDPPEYRRLRYSGNRFNRMATRFESKWGYIPTAPKMWGGENQMKILFLTRKGEGYVGAPQTRHEFEQEVAKIAECKFAGEDWPLHRPKETIDETVKRVMPDADWVIDRDNALHEPKPEHRTYRLGFFITDLHAKHFYKTDVHGHIKLLNKAGYDAIFTRYPNLYGIKGIAPTIYEDRLEATFYWIPWSVDTTSFKPQEKKIDVAFIGSLYKCYPLRRRIWKSLRKIVPDALMVEAPKGSTYERSIEKLKEHSLVGQRYVDTVNKTRILIFSASIYMYPIQKFFQGTASMCACMSNRCSGDTNLGFYPAVSYFNIDMKDWKNKLRFLLRNPDKTQKLAENGHKITTLFHTHEIRAHQFLEALEK